MSFAPVLTEDTASPAPQVDGRTRALFEAPILATLLRLAAPNILVMIVQASVGFVETYFVGWLGTASLAGVALVFPVMMLAQMMSAGAGISSAIARALGVLFGLGFTVAVLGGGRWLYGAMGGTGPSLRAALTYSNVVFAGAVLLGVFNSLGNVIRGTGNMAVPAIVTCAGAAALIPLSPCLILGWGPFPRLGIAGGAVAVLVFYAAGSLALASYLWSGRSVLRPSFRDFRFRWPLFREILRVGAVAAVITLQTNITIVSPRATSAASEPQR
jgi:Na+-driven multidrug efflux pump